MEGHDVRLAFGILGVLAGSALLIAFAALAWTPSGSMMGNRGWMGGPTMMGGPGMMGGGLWALAFLMFGTVVVVLLLALLLALAGRREYPSVPFVR